MRPCSGAVRHLMHHAMPQARCKAVQSADRQLCNLSVCTTKTVPRSQVCAVYLSATRMHLMFTVRTAHDHRSCRAPSNNRVSSTSFATVLNARQVKCWEGHVIFCHSILRAGERYATVCNVTWTDNSYSDHKTTCWR